MFQGLQDFSKKDNDKREKLNFQLQLTSTYTWQLEWSFIKDTLLKKNISYHLQYIEFLILLFNNYKVYLAMESLVSKDIIIHINSIIEASLYYTVYFASGRINNTKDQDEYYKLVNQQGKEEYHKLINQACNEFKIISHSMVDLLHWIRKQRNLQHIQGENNRELDKYNFLDANKAIELLGLYKNQLDEYYSKHGDISTA